MKLIEINKDQKEIYNDFVAAQESGSFLQSWEWGEWQEALGREVRRYFIGTDNNPSTSSGPNGNNIIGSIQLIKMPLPFGKYYLYAPYGPVVSGQGTGYSGQFLQELQKQFPDCIFIRIEPKDLSLISNLSSLTKITNIQPGKTLIIDLTKSEEQLLAEMHPKTRYNIRLAQKHGVEIKDEFALTIGKGLYAKEAVELIYDTSKRQAYQAQNKDYFENLINFFAVQNHSGDLKLHIYKALYKNELLSSAIMIDFGNTRTYLFGGSSDQQKNLMAPYLLHFQAMLDGKKLGLKYYDFWGVETASGAVPGFVRFKLGFGGTVKEYAGAYDVVNNNLQYKIYKLMRLANRLFRF